MENHCACSCAAPGGAALLSTRIPAPENADDVALAGRLVSGELAGAGDALRHFERFPGEIGGLKFLEADALLRGRRARAVEDPAGGQDVFVHRALDERDVAERKPARIEAGEDVSLDEIGRAPA